MRETTHATIYDHFCHLSLLRSALFHLEERERGTESGLWKKRFLALPEMPDLIFSGRFLGEGRKDGNVGWAKR